MPYDLSKHPCTCIYKDHSITNIKHCVSDFVETSRADKLHDNVRILCLILTTENNFLTKALVVNATWARRCNSHYFVLATNLVQNDIIKYPFNESRDVLLHKVRHAFYHIYDNLIDTFDWVLKADDDTYVIMENLRFLLSHHKPNEPGYLGFHFNNYIPNSGYMSGGAGYVISNRALRRLVEFGLNKDDACAITNSKLIPEVSEDFEIGKCLKEVGVPVLSSVDIAGRESFHPYPLSQYLFESLPQYLYEWANNQQKVVNKLFTWICFCSNYFYCSKHIKHEAVGFLVYVIVKLYMKMCILVLYD